MGWFLRKLKGGIQCLKEHGFRYTAQLFLKKSKNISKKALKQIFLAINSVLAEIAQKLEEGFVVIIPVKTHGANKNVYYVYLCGKRIYPILGGLSDCGWADPKQPIVYLKVNRMAEYTRLCVQQWVDIVQDMKSDYYFICDNKQLEYHLLRTVIFPSGNVKFIPSMRKELKEVSQMVSTSDWHNAACAHLTPFYHVKKQGRMAQFWTIDADDTLFCMERKKAVCALQDVAHLAGIKGLSVISLDIWHSWTHSRHWSWGIAYVNDNVDFCALFKSTKDLSWINAGSYAYRLGNGQTNFDWFFTYLKKHQDIKIETFYIDHAYFIHWGNFLQIPPMVAGVYFWSDGKLTLPIYRYLHHNDRLGFVDIAKDCIKIDAKLTQSEGIKFLNENLTHIK